MIVAKVILGFILFNFIGATVGVFKGDFSLKELRVPSLAVDILLLALVIFI